MHVHRVSLATLLTVHSLADDEGELPDEAEHVAGGQPGCAGGVPAHHGAGHAVVHVHCNMQRPQSVGWQIKWSGLCVPRHTQAKKSETKVG